MLLDDPRGRSHRFEGTGCARRILCKQECQSLSIWGPVWGGQKARQIGKPTRRLARDFGHVKLELAWFDSIRQECQAFAIRSPGYVVLGMGTASAASGNATWWSGELLHGRE